MDHDFVSCRFFFLSFFFDLKHSPDVCDYFTYSCINGPSGFHKHGHPCKSFPWKVRTDCYICIKAFMSSSLRVEIPTSIAFFFHDICTPYTTLQSWISLGCSIRLLYLFLKHYKDVDITNKFRYGGARCVAWHILLSTSIAMLVSSIYIFVACDCHRSVQNLAEVQKIKVLCRRTALSLGLGVSYAFVTIMVLIEIKYVKEYSQDLLLEGEALFSIIIFVSITIGLIYITSIGGPAKSINTLYVATWGTFLISGHLSLSSVVDLMKRNKKIRQGGRSHSSSFNRNEN